MSDLVGLTGGAALAGGGGRNLVFFARHFGVCGLLIWEFGDGGCCCCFWWRKRLEVAWSWKAVMGKFGRQNFGGEWGAA
jgi:hypothetical protein